MAGQNYLKMEEQARALGDRIYDLSAGSVSVRQTGESFRAVRLK